METNKRIYVTEPDAERLGLLHSYVHSQLHGIHFTQLKDKLELAEICEPAEIPADVITMNSSALLRELDTGASETVTLVFPAMANVRRKSVSVLGSLGRAMLGARPGDILEYESSCGRRRQRVERVIYQPESKGLFYD